MVSVQAILEYFPLVTIWVALPALPAGDPLEKIQGNSRCGSALGRFGTQYPLTFALESSHPRISIGCCTSGIMTLTRKVI